MNLSAIVLEKPTESFAGLFTRNSFPGAPIRIARDRMKQKSIAGLVINNRIANVCASGGVEDADRVARRCAELAGLPLDSLLPASTGIIGWRIPVDAMLDALDPLVKRLGHDGPLDVARSIMTTDAYPKLRSTEVGDGMIMGVAKGAGMIEPDMATLLLFLCTDVQIERERLESSLRGAIRESFNVISIDSDQSTSDMAVIMSSNLRSGVGPDEFDEALTNVCRELAWDVVRNGEGAEHVIHATTTSAPSEEVARACAKAVVNSPLVKTAICGNDPNVGRVIMAVGDFLGSRGIEINPDTVRLSIGDEQVFGGGVFGLTPETERRLADYLAVRRMLPSEGFPPHEQSVEIVVDLGIGSARGEAVGSDLTHGYVSENADYRS